MNFINKLTTVIFIILLIIFLIPIIIIGFFTPVLTAYIVRFFFRNGMAVPPENYNKITAKVLPIINMQYNSEYKSNFLDIFMPVNATGRYPLVLWIHGGAFVGGNKEDIGIYATALAAKGFTVACIDYRRAPEAKYPTPVIQAKEAYEWLISEADTYHIDVKNIVLAGDSAGAHIAAQLAAIQTNEQYAKKISVKSVIPQENLKALLLFCGPFDLEKISTDKSFLMKLIKMTAWAYFGTKKWVEKYGNEINITEYITPDYPPTFISDGNTASFESHGSFFWEHLDKNNIPNEIFLIPKEIEKTMHEYQFIMNTPSGIESFEKTVNFLEKYTRSDINSIMN